MFNRRKFMKWVKESMPNIDECSNKKQVLKILKGIYIDKSKTHKNEIQKDDCSWNRFVDFASEIDVETATSEQIKSYIIYELYSACESGNGFVEFFNYTTNNLKYDAYEVLCELMKLDVSDELKNLFSLAMRSYDFGVSVDDTEKDIEQKELKRDEIIEREIDPILFSFSDEIVKLASKESEKF